MNLSYILLITAAVAWVLSFAFAMQRSTGESLKESLHSKVSAEETQNRYDKYNRLKKSFFVLGILIALIAAAVAVIPRLIEMNAAGWQH